MKGWGSHGGVGWVMKGWDRVRWGGIGWVMQGRVAYSY